MNNEKDFNKKVKQLKSYIERVSNGEDIESVQADFKENFEHVPAKLIAKAEQRMIDDGARMEDIQKLCDIHSVLFHDMTDEERLERLKEEMEAHQLTNKKKEIENVNDEVSEKTLELVNTEGHPLNILKIENTAIKSLTEKINDKLDHQVSLDLLSEEISILRTIRNHYVKKDDLLFPLLKDKYDYPGPANVMWGVEDEIREQLHNVEDVDDLVKVIKRIDEMIYKEENILFPLCSENFSDEDWIAIASEIPLYKPCIVESLPLWDIDSSKENEIIVDDDIISLPGGSLTLKQLRAILNILPMEITIIDENDINRFFDEDKNKVFLRPKTVLNCDMHSCHPSKVMRMVDNLLNDFKSGARDSMHVLSYVDGKQVLTNYFALRDDEDNYLGTMEAVLHIDGIVDCTSKSITGPVSYDDIFPN